MQKVRAIGNGKALMMLGSPVRCILNAESVVKKIILFTGMMTIFRIAMIDTTKKELVMTKPRICLSGWTAPGGRRVWWCSNLTHQAHGLTPFAAYENWLKLVYK